MQALWAAQIKKHLTNHSSGPALRRAAEFGRYIKMEKPRIFISYCHKDIKKVRKIDADLSILEEIEIIRDERKLSFTDT